MKENLIKAAMIFGGGALLFYLIKPKKDSLNSACLKPSQIPPTETKSLDASSSDKKFSEQDLKNAEIAASAYAEALKNGENSKNLSELNKELSNEFGVRCYVSDKGKLVVCDTSGITILTK